ncbi:MAG: sulfotransferase domain-containing protein, partial [Pseudomonadota bacterium]
HPWFDYSQFLDDWLGRPGTCLVRFEDCLADAATELTRMLRYLDEPIDLDKINEVVEATSFKAITREKYAENRDAGQTDNSKFHRKGVAGDWKNHFNAEARALFEQIEGSSLRRLGYESDGSWVHEA